MCSSWVCGVAHTVLVILQFFPEFTTISPGVAMLPLLIVLAITMIKDGYEDIKRHQSDRAVNRQKTYVLHGSGWKNHNRTEAKSRSIRVLLTVVRQYFSPRSWGIGKKPAAARAPEDPHVVHRGAPDAPRVTSPTPMSPIEENEPAEFATPMPMPQSPHADTGPWERHPAHARPSLNSERSFSEPSKKRHSSMSERSLHHSGKGLRWRNKHWEDLHVGDIVRLNNNDEVPADIVICSTSEGDGSCYVETRNLDGEINLKSRYAVPELTEMNTPEACATVPFQIEVEPQNTDMYRFNARAILHDELNDEGEYLQCPITLNQVLLRGCTVRNTDWVIGVVTMTGLDSKIVLNSGDTPSKRSRMEFTMNRMVYVNLAIIAVIAVVCAIADARLEQYFFQRTAYWQYGAVHGDDNPNINGLIAFANSPITFQNFVPISLYISFEVVRTIQALFIFEDHDMFYEKASRRTTAKSWNLSDELGQIQYILSDKTGTLTQNLMIFRECSIAGTVYHGDEPQDKEKASTQEEEPPANNRMRVRPSLEDVPPYKDARLTGLLNSPSEKQFGAADDFFHCLSLCHTVHIAKTDERNVIMYKAESPDEQALVQTAADNGYVYCGRHVNTVELQVPTKDKRERYEVLHTIEFSSARKRMSVILRRYSDNEIIMYSKGADAMIYSRMGPGQEDMQKATDGNLEEFASKGLRTLCLAQRTLDVNVYKTWAHKYQEASVSTTDREERMEELASELEQDLQLIGATAIEDRLQDGVPETIADLKRAGINIWVATGDKLETAVAIGYSTMLLSQDMNLVIIRGGAYGTTGSAYEQLERAIERFFGGREALTDVKHEPPPAPDTQGVSRTSHGSQLSLVGEHNGERPGGYALVIDGHALGYALDEPYSRELLLKVAVHCRAVVCCRVSPLQKALIVRLVRDGLKGMTLAIGDGANDVSMIQAAHVGVGVAGEEGLQAVNSSDYAIGQFRFLKRLLLVHGHWSFYRNSKMINLFFYKQVVHTGTLFWFQIYCAWSTTQAMDYVYLLLYNAIWTVAPVVGVGLFDRNVSDRVLMEVPELYTRSRKGSYFGMGRFYWYMLDGLYQSVVLFFFFMYFYDTTTPRNDGYDINIYEPTTGMVMATVLLANLYCALDTLAWTWWIVFAVSIGPFLIFVFAPIYAAFPPALAYTYSWGNNYALYRSVQFWFAGIFTVFLGILPRLLFEYFRMLIAPTDIDLLRIVDSRDPDHDYIHDQRMPGMRAAQAYEPEVEMEGDTTMRSFHGDSYPLMPTASRTSSRHYDMSTGQESIYRGYSYAASDTPSQRPRSTLRRLGRKLKPKNLLRKRTPHQPEEPDVHYTRARENAEPAVPLRRDASVSQSEAYTGKRESMVDESVMQDSSAEEPVAAPPLFGQNEPPLFNQAPSHSVSDTFFSVIEPDSPSGRQVSGTYETPVLENPLRSPDPQA